MIINFDKIALTNMPEFKGGTGSVDANMFFDGDNRIFKAVLKKGSSIGYHIHDTSSEMMYIVSGIATVNYNGEISYAKKGELHYCKKGNMHSVSNEQDEDLVMICIVPNQ